jgi:signal transduction histidine kinase
MRRHDGTEFPVTFEVSQGDFPAAVMESSAPSGDGVQFYLVALRDMTDVLRQRDDERSSARTKTAVGMIAEMAHVVRNPLTAIRGAGQLLNSALDSMFTQSSQINEADWHAVRSMCGVIHQQTKELDDKVETFMRWAVEDPGRLRELLADADAWAAKVFSRGGNGNGQNPPG